MIRSIIHLVFLTTLIILFVYPVYSLWAWEAFALMWLMADVLLTRKQMSQYQLISRLVINVFFMILMWLLFAFQVYTLWVWIVFVLIWFGTDYLVTNLSKQNQD